METEKSTLEQITDLIRWYNKLSKGYHNVTDLQDSVRKMATLIFYFAVEVGEAYEQKNQKEFGRKASFSREQDYAMKDGKSAAAAEAIARKAVESLLDLEQQADSIYRKSYLLLESAKDVMEAMRQHISNLKQERSLELRGGMDNQR